MELERFLEIAKKLERRKGKKEQLDRMQKFFDRFHLLNRKYLDRETFEKSKASISGIAEAVSNTIRFLDEEIARLRSKRMKMAFENVALSEMQKAQSKNALLLKEYLANFPDSAHSAKK